MSDFNVMRNFVYGLFVLSSADGEKASGCIINTAIQAASSPNVITIAVSKNGYTASLIQRSRKFNLSIIDEDADFDLFRHFGFQSGRDVDKFTGYEHKRMAENGIWYVTKGTNAWISCEVDQMVDLGSHLLFIAYVTGSGKLSDTPSMSYTWYHERVKPQPEQTKGSRKAWRCTICGYIYEHPDLPADFICPWCGHPASDFEEISID